MYDSDSDVGRVIVAAQGGHERSDEDLRAGIRALAASDSGLRTADREQLDALKATVDQIKALVSAAP